jgi:hypothetical protein
MGIKMIHYDTRALEFTLSFQCVAWGIWLILPLDTFSSSQVYSIISRILPEWVWGIIFLTAGILQIYSVHQYHWAFRRLMATVVLFLWVIVDVSLWVSRSSSAASITYLVFALSAMWCVVAISVRGKVNHRGN